MQRPEQLAEAGLYYTGVEDTVRCFTCDGGLRKWDPEDDPWIEHCRWFPDCPFVKKLKGEDYIGLVQATSGMDIQERLRNKDTATNKTTSNDLTSNMERLTFKDPELNSVIDEHRETCLEMGYTEKDFNIAVTKLAENGNVRPTIEDILDSIEAAEQKESQTELHKNGASVVEWFSLLSFNHSPLTSVFWKPRLWCRIFSYQGVIQLAYVGRRLFKTENILRGASWALEAAI